MKATLIGTGVGAGVGAAAGGIADANDDSGFEKIDHVATAALAIAGAGAGALVGYLLGRGGSKRELVYESK
jgi:membrane protein DedA with SNARE-associated domain